MLDLLVTLKPPKSIIALRVAHQFRSIVRQFDCNKNKSFWGGGVKVVWYEPPNNDDFTAVRSMPLVMSNASNRRFDAVNI